MVTGTSDRELPALKHPAVFWLTAFGVGMLRPAPGTWGSVAAVLVWVFLIAELSFWIQGAIVLGYTGMSLALCEYVCRKYGVADAPQIVSDEVAGMWLALLFLPSTWWIVLIAFALFRALDIFKPLAIGWLDREIGGGMGIMLDDLVAGLATGIVLKLSLLAAAAV